MTNEVLKLEPSFGLAELNNEELENTNGGVALAGAAAIAAGAGLVIGAVVVGAAVGYGVYKLCEWAFE